MSNISWDFTGRNILVTGAARGIGLGIAATFAQAGGRVFMVDIDKDELESAAASLGATALCADISDPAQITSVVQHVQDAAGGVDVLINNAGVLRDGVLWKMTDDAWRQVLAVHLDATFLFLRACTPGFRAKKGGRVINVSSFSGLHGNFGQVNYSAAKAGVIGLTKAAAKELGAFGVTVNAISPNVATRMVGSIPPEKRDEYTGPIKRFGEPEEIAAAIAFLASDEAAYITGAVLSVDGGLSM